MPDARTEAEQEAHAKLKAWVEDTWEGEQLSEVTLLSLIEMFVVEVQARMDAEGRADAAEAAIQTWKAEEEIWKETEASLIARIAALRDEIP